jgi:hypothetical protein
VHETKPDTAAWLRLRALTAEVGKVERELRTLRASVSGLQAAAEREASAHPEIATMAGLLRDGGVLLQHAALSIGAARPAESFTGNWPRESLGLVSAGDPEPPAA